MREIWIRSREKREIAVMEDGRLVEYLPEETDASAEAILLGRVPQPNSKQAPRLYCAGA